MQYTKYVTVLAILASPVMAGLSGSAHAAAPGRQAGPVIDIEDVASFYRLYDATGGHPTSEQLQHVYLDHGSPGLHRLAQMRHVTGASIAAAIAKQPDIYVNAKRCMAV